ncbi:hypothetical protein T4E_7284 [Trichinella pseudospiralis]|uniref:Uncharacterized protein n=1 Tax=Trichinella pseudospiralis TaxID=6337 RepID=A0A0V0XWV4_TRIPS|nr:hypothetical protein T4E_7284 [Trichinella pseudospiralis]
MLQSKDSFTKLNICKLFIDKERNDASLDHLLKLEKLSCLLGFDRRHPVRELDVFDLTFKNSTSICPESD